MYQEKAINRATRDLCRQSHEVGVRRPLPNTTPEQRGSKYGDIEDLITVGFLSHSVVVNGVHLSFRSLGPGDMFLLRTRLEGHSGDDWRLWAIASSVWMVNGFLVINEPQAPPFIFQMIKGSPKRGREILSSIVSGLFARQSRALDGVESYCYEGVSRYRWKSFGGASAHNHTGIPGQDVLGTNYVQRMWTFYNEIEDKRIAEESAWEGFKLVASAQAPKGIKKIDEHDKQSLQKEMARRQEVQDTFYYRSIGVLSKEDEKASKSVTGTFASKSDKDLEHEMMLWVSGQEDEHDQIVNEYKRQVIARHEERRIERERKAADFRRRLDEMEAAPVRPVPLVGYTQSQLAEILKQRQPGNPGVKTIYTEGGEREEPVYKAHIEGDLDSDGLMVTSDGRLIQGGAKRDMTQEVSQHRVPFGTRQEG